MVGNRTNVSIFGGSVPSPFKQTSSSTMIPSASPVPKSVIIVGGSLAGLMHALVLLSHPSRPQVQILERSPTELLHNQGAGIVAGNETQQFFEQYVHPGKDIAITSLLRHYLDRSGEIIPKSVDRRQQRMTSWDLLYHLLRFRVDGYESEYVTHLRTGDEERRHTARYANGCTVTGIQGLENGKVKVNWTNSGAGQGSATVDLVIAADGASSTVRRILHPGVERTYAGYVAWRGTVPEKELSAKATEALVENFTFHHSEAIQSLAYLIPGDEGTTGAGERFLNWVWYCNYKQDSAELAQLMTDIDGARHRITLPVGKMQLEVWEKQKKYAGEVLPPQFAEVVSKTRQPFVQAITDVISDQNRFLEDKVILVGDALAGFRPHTAASTGQAAFDALQLGRWLQGDISKETYDQAVLDFAKEVQHAGVVMGDRSQFGRHPFAA